MRRAPRRRTECRLIWDLGLQRVADTYHVLVQSHSEAEAYLAELNGTARELAASAHKALISEGCASYVKTIYVGYEINGEMVAALYGHSDHVEIALVPRVRGARCHRPRSARPGSRNDLLCSADAPVILAASASL